MQLKSAKTNCNSTGAAETTHVTSNAAAVTWHTQTGLNENLNLSFIITGAQSAANTGVRLTHTHAYTRKHGLSNQCHRLTEAPQAEAEGGGTCTLNSLM